MSHPVPGLEYDCEECGKQPEDCECGDCPKCGGESQFVARLEDKLRCTKCGFEFGQ